MRFYRPLLVLATLLAFGVISLGAYVRLSDAGLGCPDWPGCYGHLIGVPDEAHEQSAALASFPDSPVQPHKAWKEMAHRYFAGTLGLLIAGIAFIGWRWRKVLRQSPVLPTILLGVVTFQAMLGMWTVTLLLRPVIVSAHLLGGMATLALLVWLLLRQRTPNMHASATKVSVEVRWLAWLALITVILQISLGGWVSANYAALVCSDFPTCQGFWQPEMDFKHAFQFRRELGQTASGELLSIQALTAIHWSHRLGALIVTLVIAGLGTQLLKFAEWRRLAWLLFATLGLQIALGIANVLLSLPLALAVGHNMGAAALLALTVAINVKLAGTSQSSHASTLGSNRHVQHVSA